MDFATTRPSTIRCTAISSNSISGSSVFPDSTIFPDSTVFPAFPVAPAFPVFIVGSPRSGTSMLARIMLKVGYHGFEEGNLLGLLYTLNDAVDQHFTWFGTDNPAVLIAHVEPASMKRQIGEMFRQVFERHHPQPPWFDKTGNPTVIETIPMLVQIWPHARFIFAKRRAIENVVSRLIKFPDHSFEYHLQDWARNMGAWREVRAAMPELACIEVDQQDMVRDPIGVALRIGTLLGLSPLQQAQIVGSMTSERPQQSSFGSAERVLSLADTGWTPADVDRFVQHCKTEMDAYGYTFDERYWR